MILKLIHQLVTKLSQQIMIPFHPTEWSYNMNQILGRSLLSPCLLANLVTKAGHTDLKSTLTHINDIMSRTYSHEDALFHRNNLSSCPIDTTGKRYNRFIRDAQRPIPHKHHWHSDLPICERSGLSPDSHMPHDDYAVIMCEEDTQAPSKPAGQVFNSIGVIRTFFKEKLNIDQIFGCSADINAVIHYGTNYANAFWNSQAIFFGDGDGIVFGPFYNDIDIIAHELAHGFISSKANFRYSFQSGALNESVADVLGIMVKQYLNNETANTSNWLLGENLFIDQINAPALRSMINPGDAYYLSDEVRDPQVGHMSQYQDLPIFVDNGGVHINSGIPNRAFYLLAKSLGGYTWDIAGKIWLEAVSDNRVTKKATFIEFADATIRAAKKLFDDNIAQKTQQSWLGVGLIVNL